MKDNKRGLNLYLYRHRTINGGDRLLSHVSDNEQEGFDIIDKREKELMRELSATGATSVGRLATIYRSTVELLGALPIEDLRSQIGSVVATPPPVVAPRTTEEQFLYNLSLVKDEFVKNRADAKLLDEILVRMKKRRSRGKKRAK